MNFRKDINGLRAIAVMAVVLFHFRPSSLSGGFAGVDIFFVISGFLMTGIIIRGFRENNFNIFSFYVARANRIIPALSVLCLTLLFLGWFFLPPIEYSNLANHSASSVGFFSNMVYWKESGYFDSAAHEKWLLHTWSLSAEWQFYILYPIGLLALKKLTSIKNLHYFLILGTVLAFAFSVYASYRWPNPSYYVLPTRAWEMMIGGVAYLLPVSFGKRSKATFESLGFILILFSFFFISSDNIWPGYLTTIPVIGTILIIIANNQYNILTNNIIFSSLGKWSYSIYLWHWPVVVLLYRYDLKNFWVLGILASILLGFLSFKFIESIKFPSISSFKQLWKVKPIWIAISTFLLATYIKVESPNQYLFPMPDSVLGSFERKPYDCFDKDYMHSKNSVICNLTEGNEKIAVFGDSHAYSVLPVVENIAKENNISLYYSGFSGCPPLLGVSPIRSDQSRKNCATLNGRFSEEVIENGIKKVFLAARWTYYTEGDYNKSGLQYLKPSNSESNEKALSISKNAFKAGLEDTLSFYQENKIKVILMLQVPMQQKEAGKIYYASLKDGSLSKELLESLSIDSVQNEQFQRETNNMISEVVDKYSNVTIYNPSKDMCNETNCPVGNLERSFYFDDDHLSISV